MSKLQPHMVPPVTEAQHARMEALMDEMAAAAPDDAGIRISHVLHAGCYARTAFVPAGVLFVSNQVMVPTVVVISGDCSEEGRFCHPGSLWRGLRGGRRERR